MANEIVPLFLEGLGVGRRGNHHDNWWKAREAGFSHEACDMAVFYGCIVKAIVVMGAIAIIFWSLPHRELHP